MVEMSKINDAGVKSTKNIVNSDESCNNIDYSKEVDDWGLLISKHPLRMKIWSILKIYGELNVTQISRFVKESKSSVSRIAGEMENDYLIVSTPKKSEIKGRIASKLYKIDYKILHEHLKPRSVPKDSKKRIGFYRDRINEDRSAIKIVSEAMAQMHPLLDRFEKELDKLDAIDYMDDSDKLDTEIKKKADKLFTKYFQGELEPMYFLKYMTKEGYRLEKNSWEKLPQEYQDLMKAENEKETMDFAYYTIKMPLKAIYDEHEQFEKEKN